MLFMVEMEVVVPHNVDKAAFDKLKAEEKAKAAALQESGVWRHLWRVTGQYSNVSVFDVESADALHELMIGLPLYPFMDVKVTSLVRHPSSIRSDDS